jgi:hypothetical protein
MAESKTHKLHPNDNAPQERPEGHCAVTLSQLDDNAAASGLVIDPALFAKAEAIAAAIRMAP